MWDNFLSVTSEFVRGFMEDTGDWVSDHLVNIIAILIVAWLFRHFGVRVITGILKHTLRQDLYPTKSDREKRLKTLNSLVKGILKVGSYVVVVILLIGEINPSYTTALFASAGVIGVALGFGAQSLIKDFTSGIFIIAENQYRVGDVIRISGVDGIVEDITVRTTVLRDLDGNVHHVPNGTIDVTTNMTLGYSSINEDILVDYSTDIDHLEHVINHVGSALMADPDYGSVITEAPRLERIESFADHGILVKILAKTVTGEQWRVKAEFYKRLKVAFEKNHIEIPYPHIVTMPAKAKK